ncbi:MAG: threonylcarbamoyl-AMP synthase, partial [Acidobacteria bacterium]
MDTLLTRSPKEASEVIRSGGVVAFPTETVYGLGADVFNESAIKKIFEAKNRPADNPLIVHISSTEQVQLLAKEVTHSAKLLIEKFFPGPLTVVLPKADAVPSLVSAGLDTVGIRMPRHPIAQEFLTLCEAPVCAPSANLSGRPSPTDWKAVYEDLNGRIDCILQGDVTEIGLESTVVDCTSLDPILLRLGAISFEELIEIIPCLRTYKPLEGEPVRSPGLRHRHYAPMGSVFIVSDPRKIEPQPDPIAYIGLHEPAGDFHIKKICSSVQEYAHELYAFFRQCDRLGIR